MVPRSSFVPLATLVVSTALLAGPLFARAAPPATADKPPLAGSHSIGLAWHGMLVGGRRLEVGEHLRRAGRRQQSGNWYATTELVSLLEEVADRLALARPGARLGVGDLSGPHGGSIDGHGSHESGRDADVGFQVTDTEGHRLEADWVDFSARARPFPSARPHLQGLRFDDAANWIVVRALLESSQAEVQYVFVAGWLEQRLLREAQRAGASPELLQRASHVLMQPRNALPHADHFHVRIYCPEGDLPLCLDVPPLWPWTRAGRAAAADGDGQPPARAVPEG